MKLTGIEIRNFRSIGDKPVVLNPWRKCNILIGRNNVGKSNAIKAVQKIRQIFDQQEWHFNFDPQTDRHQKIEDNVFAFRLCFGVGNNEQDQELAQIVGLDDFVFDCIEQKEQRRLKIADNSIAQIEEFSIAQAFFHFWRQERWTRPVPINQFQETFRNGGDSILSRWFIESIHPVELIPEFRQIREGKRYRYNGEHLISLLAEYQSPMPGKEQDKEKFRQIERFVQGLLHLPDVELRVTHDKTTIMIFSNGNWFPLASYGTGVHELIILVTAVLSLENTLCCIEEPEIHLHPTLQREFIEFITTQTSNTYLISTHSPTLINAHSMMPAHARDQIQVFHLELENGVTVGGPVLDNAQSLTVLNDLGVRASDILQSNCVIWVEGPSDRIYLNRWLELVDPELVEGLHYSIMFYGGRLLSHLTVNRANNEGKVPEELIDLLRINQNAIVVMDSDRSKKRARISATKLRISKECDETKSHCWISDEREIENYIPTRVVIAACEELVSKTIHFSTDDPYQKFEVVLQDELRKANAEVFDYSRNKVHYASELQSTLNIRILKVISGNS